MSLSDEDKLVFKLLEKANEQYEHYLALTDVTCLPLPENFTEPVYDWDHPLTLVIHNE
jgi:hypothetical protein